MTAALEEQSGLSLNTKLPRSGVYQHLFLLDMPQICVMYWIVLEVRRKIRLDWNPDTCSEGKGQIMTNKYSLKFGHCLVYSNLRSIIFISSRICEFDGEAETLCDVI